MRPEGKFAAVEVQWDGSNWKPTGREIPFAIPVWIAPPAELRGVAIEPVTPGCKWIVQSAEAGVESEYLKEGE